MSKNTKKTDNRKGLHRDRYISPDRSVRTNSELLSAESLRLCAPVRYKNNFWPALVRQYGEIEGPYVLQMDACKCLANGVDRFNEYMGREAIRVIFRGRDEEDPKARCAGRPWRRDSAYVFARALEIPLESCRPLTRIGSRRRGASVISGSQRTSGAG